jgi:uncharacterized protein YukE
MVGGRMTTIDVTPEILQQIRADIRELREEVRAELRDVRSSIDGLDARVGVVEYTMRGMAVDMHAVARLLRQVADEVADHGRRLDEIERDR